MIEVTQAFQNAWLNGNQKLIQLNFSDNTTLDDDSIVAESFSMRQALCEESQLAFGLTASTEVSIQIFNAEKQYKGLSVNIIMGAVDEEENYYTMDLGTYKIEEDIRSDDRVYRTLTAYDPLYYVLNEDYSTWYSSLNSTFTLKQFRDSFFSHIGITQETYTLIQDSVTLHKKSGVTSLSGRQIIQAICETSACFGFINYDGKFQYVSPSVGGRHFPADDLYPSNDLYPGDGADIVIDASDDEAAPIYGGLVYSDYYTHKITGARFAYTENTPSASTGTSTNQYQFEDSVLYYGQSAANLQSIAATFVNATGGFFYIPASIKARARVWAQLGDMLIVQAGANSVLMPILERDMQGITALYDTYTAKGSEYYMYSANSLTARMTENEAKTAEVNDAVVELDDDINNPVTGVKVTFQQELDSLEATVAGTTEIWDETNYNISVYGYDTPDNEGYTPSSYTNQYYLNQTTGYVYQSNGSAWNYVAALTKIQAALQSQITQNAGQILLKVSKGNVSSEISQEAGQITLSAGRLVINSGNFTLDSSGNATATNFYAKETLRLANTAGTYTVYLKATSAYRTGYPMLAIRDASDNLADLNCDQIRANSVYSGGRTVITSGNIGSQSVSYADSAGSANSVAWSNVTGKPTIPSNYLTGVSSGGRESGTGKYMVHSMYKSGSDVEYTTMEVTGASDRRLKVDIKPLDDFTDLYMDLGVYKFKYNHKLKSTRMRDYVHYGIMAQDTMALYEKYGIPSEKISLFYKESCDEVQAELTGEKTYWSMNRDDLHALHIQMIQKQQKKIDNLELEVSELKAKLKEVVNVG